jgi:hypothetical protein
MPTGFAATCRGQYGRIVGEHKRSPDKGLEEHADLAATCHRHGTHRFREPGTIFPCPFGQLHQGPTSCLLATRRCTRKFEPLAGSCHVIAAVQSSRHSSCNDRVLTSARVRRRPCSRPRACTQAPAARTTRSSCVRASARLPLLLGHMPGRRIRVTKACFERALASSAISPYYEQIHDRMGRVTISEMKMLYTEGKGLYTGTENLAIPRHPACLATEDVRRLRERSSFAPSLHPNADSGSAASAPLYRPSPFGSELLHASHPGHHPTLPKEVSAP